MPVTGFFRVTWSVQLLAGIGLFVVSSLIEFRILASFFAAPTTGAVLTAALELGKAAAIVWHRYLAESGPGAYPSATRAFSIAFRVGLLTFSVLCSLLYLGTHLDRLMDEFRSIIDENVERPPAPGATTSQPRR